MRPEADPMGMTREGGLLVEQAQPQAVIFVSATQCSHHPQLALLHTLPVGSLLAKDTGCSPRSSTSPQFR